MYFYPRPPRGGRRCYVVAAGASLVFLSTPSARRATDFVGEHSGAGQISIHALREEGDGTPSQIFSFASLFLSTPSARRATNPEKGIDGTNPFLSTPSARRATLEQPQRSMESCNFYPRPPRGGRLHKSFHTYAKPGFLSTPSARRATPVIEDDGRDGHISIHALREEGDGTVTSCIVPVWYFYPRPPRGGRPLVPCLVAWPL